MTHSCRLIELNSLGLVFGRVSIGGKAGKEESTQENADEILEEDLQAGLKGIKLYPVNHLFHVNDSKAEKIYPVTVDTGSYS